MEKRLKRIEIITVLILILIVGNLISSVTTSFNNSNSKNTVISKNKDLPSDVTRQFSDKIINKLKTDYNLSDWKELHKTFGEFAKAQIGVDQISNEFKKLRAATGKINTYVYSHYLYEGNNNDAEWFELQYKCRFDNGKGTIKLSTRTVDGISEIVGIVINLDEL